MSVEDESFLLQNALLILNPSGVVFEVGLDSTLFRITDDGQGVSPFRLLAVKSLLQVGLIFSGLIFLTLH